MDFMKVSVIIPVYNREKYIKECIKSIFTQTLSDIEVIVTDDGSNDNTPGILSELQKHYSNLRVIKCNHTGASSARNKGIDAACGEYITFVDSDDFLIENKYLENTYNMASYFESDVVVCANYLQDIYIEKSMLSTLSPFRLFIKASILRKNPDVRFPEHIQMGEDYVFATSLMCVCSRINFRFSDYYFYRNHENQITNIAKKNFSQMGNQVEKIITTLDSFYCTRNLFQTQSLRFCTLLGDIISWGYYNNKENNAEKIRDFNLVKSYFNAKLRPNLGAADYKKLDYKLRFLAGSKNQTLFELRLKLSQNKLFHRIYLFKNALNTVLYKLKRFFTENFKVIHPDEKRFIKNFLANINPDRVLIAEANDFHSETLPSYVEYLHNFGFRCDILMTPRAALKDVFFNVDKNFDINIITARHNVIMSLLKRPEIKKYKNIIIASDEITMMNKKFTSLKNLKSHNVIIFEHNLENINDKIAKDYKLTCLCPHANKKFEKIVINPHFFGNFETRPKNDTTHFISIGRIQNSRQNYDLIYKSINSLKNEGIFNFKAALAGSPEEKVNPYLLCDKNFTLISSPDFKQLYDILEMSDFILMPFDLNDKRHLKYLTSVTSGQVQLALGFLKPVIINEKFAHPLGFNSTNAVLYRDNELFGAMKKAINMSAQEYSFMQQNLKNLKESLYILSKENFYNLLNK